MATMNYPSSHSNLQTISAAPPYPKIVSLLGADTKLGSEILRDLISSPQVDKVFAIAFNEFALIEKLPQMELRKVRVIITKADKLDKSLSRIPECDISFCILSTDRHASSVLSPIDFYSINYTCPVKFITRMFHLGCLNISILSHINADSNVKSEFYNLKAQLEQFIKSIRKDACQFAPIISIFKMPSHIMATPPSNHHPNPDIDVNNSNPTTTTNNGNNKDLNDKLDSDLRVRDVAAAMEIDAFYKASFKLPPGIQKKKSQIEIFDSRDVHHILQMADYQDSWYGPV